jgi:MFS family permease
MRSNVPHLTEAQRTAPSIHKADWRQGWILVVSGFVPVMAIIALAPTLPTLLAHFHDVPNASLWVPLLITAPSACIALFAPGAGAIADRFGRRPLLLWSLVLFALGGLVPFVLDSFAAVVAGRVVIGIGEAGILTVVNTLLADYYEEEARHRWLMIQGIVGSILGTVTIAGSGFLAAVGWQWPFLVYAVAIPIFFASLAFVFEPESRRRDAGAAHPAQPSTAFPYRAAFTVMAVTVLAATIYYVQVINFSVLLKEMGVVDPKSIGLSMALPSLGVPLGSIVFKLTTRFGAKAQITAVLLGYTIGLGGIGLAPDYRIALAFAFIQQLANGVVLPALITWAQTCFSFEHRGRGMGWWASSFFIAQFLSPAAVSLMVAAVGNLQGAFLAFGMISGACAVVACMLYFHAAQSRRAHPMP